MKLNVPRAEAEEDETRLESSRPAIEPILSLPLGVGDLYMGRGPSLSSVSEVTQTQSQFVVV